jgi:predicted permease
MNSYDDLNQEIRAHIDLEVQRNIENGMTPEEARAAALRTFGNVAGTKERVWEMRPGAWLDSLRQDVCFAIRGLRRAPGFAAVAVLTLALGIGASATMFSVIRAVLLRPLPYHDPERLFEISGVDGNGRATSVSLADFQELRERAAGFERMSASTPHRTRSLLLTGTPEPANTFAVRVDGAFFSAMGVAPQLGRFFREAESAAVAVISHRLWQQHLNSDPGVVGRSILLNGEGHTVIGVMPAGFQYPHRVYDLWLPLEPEPEELRDRSRRNAAVVARLKPGLKPERAQKELEALARDLAAQYPSTNRNWRPVLRQVGEQQISTVRRGVWLLGGAVGCVLLMACLNVANLLLARAAERRHEIAIRAALGAGRGRLVRQLLVESLALAVLGAGLGLLLSVWAGRAVAGAFGQLVPRIEETRLDPAVLAFAVAATGLTTVLAGAWPALRATSTRLAVSRFPVSPSGLLVAAQVAICLVLLAGAGLMLRSLGRLLEVDPGFRAQQVVTMRIPIPGLYGPGETQQVERYRRIIEHARRLPGVEGAGFVTILPLGPVQANLTFGIADRPVPPDRFDELPRAQLRTVSSDYFLVMGIPVLRGRAFRDADGREAPGVVIVNEELARRYWPGEDPVGKRLQTDIGPKGTWLTVVGVVGDVKHASLRDRPDPELYRPYLQYLGFPQWAMLAVRTAGDPLALSATLRREIRRLEPDQPIGEIKTMEQFVRDSLGRPRFYAVLLGIFAGLALLVAATGLFGVLSYAVSRRTQEIGVRMALGACPAAVLGMVMAGAGRLLAAGVALGLAGAWGATRLLRGLLFEVTPTDPLALGGAALVLLLAALAATAIPARRAVRVDPMVALRHEP